MAVQLRDAANNPLYGYSFTGTRAGLATSAASSFNFDLRGLIRKTFTLKNGTNALVNGSLFASQEGVNWQVVDGTTFNTAAANALLSSQVLDPRRFYMFTGSCGTVTTITFSVSASSF